MHAISSYLSNRPTDTHKQTNPQTGPIEIHCATKLSAQFKIVVNMVLYLLKQRWRQIVVGPLCSFMFINMFMSERAACAMNLIIIFYLLKYSKVYIFV